MIVKTTSLAFASVCLMAVSGMPTAHAQYAQPPAQYAPPPPAQTAPPPPQVVTNGPQTDQGDLSSGWSARQNVIESQRYDRLLEMNRGFREARVRKECGPITDPQLHADCLASFHQDEPFAGSSTPPRSNRSGYGR
jgi:hypothetical protein